jgi:hypothetical protein
MSHNLRQTVNGVMVPPGLIIAMADSLSASPAGLARIDRQRKLKGWTKTVTFAWWETAMTSRATLKRFWRGQPIQKDAFIEICRAVGIADWQAIAEPPSPSVPPDLSPDDSPNLRLETAPDLAPETGSESPDISGFYGRSAELSQLTQWILGNGILGNGILGNGILGNGILGNSSLPGSGARVVAIYGKPGIGKTTLAAVVVDAVQMAGTEETCRDVLQTPSATKAHREQENKEADGQAGRAPGAEGPFQRVIWRSLSAAPTWDVLLTDILHSLPPVDRAGQDLTAQLLAALRQTRCLLVLDQVDVLQPGSQGKLYRPGYDAYGEGLQRLAMERHASCVVVISQEPIPALNLGSVRSLPLKGLTLADAKTLLQAHDLADPQQWDALIQQYGTEPQLLTLTATMIQRVFNRRVATFLQESGTFIIPPDIKYVLDRLFKRLSDPEKQVLQRLAQSDRPLDFSTLQARVTADGGVSKADFLPLLESLLQQSLIERILTTTPTGEDIGLFTLQLVVKKYVLRCR